MSEQILHTFQSRENIDGTKFDYRLVRRRNLTHSTEYFSRFEGGQWVESGDAFVADEMARLVARLGEQRKGEGS